MFCFQCEQTLDSKGCVLKRGICSKHDTTSDLQDDLISRLIKLALEVEHTEENSKIISEGLFITVSNVNYNDEFIKKFIEKIENKVQYDSNKDFHIKTLWQEENQDIRSLKSLILFSLKGSAAYYHHANILGFFDDTIAEFFFTALADISKNLNQDELLKLVLKTGEINLKCMALLDRANTSTFQNPTPTVVPLTVEKGPFIVISGHDLKDLKLLLEQTKDKGINIYTHGEMLPAHGYPDLKHYKHLKGNFGTAWQNQKKEFDSIPAPVLFTTNCILPPLDSYKDRVFTTSVVSHPDAKYIDEKKDFTPIIEMALKLKGYPKDKEFFALNGGNTVTTGFGCNYIIQNAPKIIDLIKQEKIKNIFLIGGCDGAKPGRNYYSEFAKLVPKDSIIITLACGKYRFNDIDFGEIEGIPRLLDMGQCNDAYGAIFVAQSLAQALNTEINKLPLHFILSWYEQKAVAILLTLLYLNIQNIYLGPTLPAFVSENVLKILIEKFNIKKISTPKEDLDEILNS